MAETTQQIAARCLHDADFARRVLEGEEHPEVRSAIAAALYTAARPEQVLVFTGAEEPIFAFMNVALEYGDGIIVHTPSYQSLHEVARSIGCAPATDGA